MQSYKNNSQLCLLHTTKTKVLHHVSAGFLTCNEQQMLSTRHDQRYYGQEKLHFNSVTEEWQVTNWLLPLMSHVEEVEGGPCIIVLEENFFLKNYLIILVYFSFWLFFFLSFPPQYFVLWCYGQRKTWMIAAVFFTQVIKLFQ